MTNTEITDLLRRRIVADMHLGRLKPGARLPSLRMIAQELGISIRAAARAYATLERDGLVTVRGRSGIYLVAPFAVDIQLTEPLAWYADMLKDAWSRRLALTDVTNMLAELVQNPLRAACVESTEDHMVAFCAELEEDFSLITTSVKLTDQGAIADGVPVSLLDAFAGVDFIVTTAFHAADVYEAAETLQKPVVVVSVNETLLDSFESQLEAGAVTIVADDPAFVERFRTYLIERFRRSGELKVFAVDDIASDGNLTNGSTLMYTRAARKRLNEEEYHLVPPPVAFLSDRAARKVLQCMLSTHGQRMLQPA
ncbi:MAG TPA: winged helix-turn-helix domain-containing protein [Longimicrobiales bacterium]